MRVSEAFGLRLNADLVVLSGCSTGLGKVTGDGILGLARAFLYAGTPSVVVSQWDVSDRATAFLMDRFYAGMQAGHGKARSLREAQMATRARYPASRPVGGLQPRRRALAPTGVEQTAPATVQEPRGFHGHDEAADDEAGRS